MVTKGRIKELSNAVKQQAAMTQAREVSVALFGRKAFIDRAVNLSLEIQNVYGGRYDNCTVAAALSNLLDLLVQDVQANLRKRTTSRWRRATSRVSGKVIQPQSAVIQ